MPIRLEFDVDAHKMRDTFVWNLNGSCLRGRLFRWQQDGAADLLDSPSPDPIVTPEIFAQTVVDDYGLNPTYHAIITKSIQEQLSDYKAHSATFGEDGVMIDEPEDVLAGRFSEEETAWWEAWRKRVRSKALYKLPNPPDTRVRKRRKVVKDEAVERPDALAAASSGDVPMTVDDFEEDESLMHEEMRILVKVRRPVPPSPSAVEQGRLTLRHAMQLDIIVGSYKLEDQFEWDLENVDPTPEQFAEIYAKDLGLGGEFR